MRRRLAATGLAALAAVAVLILGKVPAQAQANAYALAPYTAAYEPRTVDERGLWMAADEYEKVITASGILVRDERLTGYVRRVLCKTVGADRCNGVRIYILDIPAFNATMAANGAMTVWTGLLLRARSEAELGAVLGHEFAHFELRHSLRGFQSQRSTSDVLAWVQVLGGIAQRDTSDLRLSLVGSMYRFNRDQEKEADLLGLKYLANSGYPGRAASEVWQHLMEEADATASGRKVTKRHLYTAGFFATHPTELDRADYLLRESLKYPNAGQDPGRGYYDAVGPLFPHWLAAQAKLNDFGGTEYILGGIAGTTGWTGQLLHARAEMFATRGNPRDLITATTLYLNAIDAGHDRPETLRGLGLSLVKSGNRAEGGKYLSAYLKAMPDAPDAGLIRLYIPASNGDK